MEKLVNIKEWLPTAKSDSKKIRVSMVAVFEDKVVKVSEVLGITSPATDTIITNEVTQEKIDRMAQKMVNRLAKNGATFEIAQNIISTTFIEFVVIRITGELASKAVADKVHPECILGYFHDFKSKLLFQAFESLD